MDLAFGRLTQLAFGYWQAQPLFSLTTLGVFEQLAAGALSPVVLAERLRLSPQTLERLLLAGVPLGLLRLREGLVENTELSTRYLLEDSEESLTPWVRVMGRWAAPWTQLNQAILSGKPVEDQGLRLGDDPEYLRDFILGMHAYARRTAPQVAMAMGLADARRLVDVGGGAGTYSMALCELHPALHATVLDLPPVLDITRVLVQKRGLTDRIDTGVVDYRCDALGHSVDAVLFSNVLHQESEAVAVDMLTRARAALRPGGKVLVHGHFLTEERTGPTFSVLHNLSALVLWEGGGSPTLKSMSAMLEQAGFLEISGQSLSASATGLVVGVRP